MNAIEMLEEQHDQVAALFKKAENAAGAEKERFFVQIADALAMHATIEEKIFYPAVLAKPTHDILFESVEEHLEIKRLIADLLDLEPGSDNFDAKMKVLRENVEHHVGEERQELFPKVRKILSAQELDGLGNEMQVMMETLEDDEPRFAVRSETTSAAPL